MASVDQRVVELKFNAKNFQSGIQAAIASLDNLKKNLNMNKAANEFDKVEKASKNVTFKDLYSSVDSISKRFTTFGIIGMSALNQITTTAMQTGKKLLSALTSPLIEGGKRRALNIEQAKFQIQGLGYTWESVEEDINYGVKDTAYGLDAAAKAASQLLASQVKVGEEMKASLRGISGVAAMTSSEYEDVANIFTTVAGNGRVMGDQLMQLSTRGLNAAATLGQYLGKTEGEVRDMVSKGQIDFQTFAKAMDSAFGEHAKKANETFTGSLSNMKAALARIGAEVASPAYVHLRDIFNSLTPVFDGIKAALVEKGGLIDSIKAGMSYVANFVTKILDGLGGKEGVASALSSVFEKLNRIVKAFGSLALGIAKTISGIVTPIFSAFGEVLGNSILDAFAGAIEILAKFVNSLVFTERMSSNLKKTFVGIFTVVDALFKVITKIISVVAGGLFTAFSAAFGFVADVMLAITGHIGDFILRIKQLVISIYNLKTVQDVLTAISVAFSKIKSVASTAYRAVRKFAGTLIDAAFESALWIFDKMAEAILLVATFIDKAITKLREFISWVKQLPAVQNFISTIRNVFENLRENIGGVASDLSTKFISAFNSAREVIGTFIGRIKELIEQYIELPTLQDVITSVVDVLTKTFEKAVELFNKAKEIVSNLFDRIAELNRVSLSGIIENFGKLRDKIIEVIDISGRLAWLKNTFGTITSGVAQASQQTGSLLDQIKEKLLQFVSWAKDKFANLSMGDVMAAGVGGTFIVFLVQLTKFIKTADKLTGSIDKIAGAFNKITKAITETIHSFGELAKAKAQSIKIEAISSLIKSVVLLAGAVALLASMDPTRVVTAAGVLLILAGGLIGLTAAMEAITSKSNPEKIAATASQMITASGSILVMAAALKLLSTIPVEALIASMIAITILMGEVIGFMAVMNKLAPEAQKDSLSMLMVASSLLVLARAMIMIGSLSVGEIISSMIVITVLMSSLGIMFKLAGEVAMTKRSAAAIVAIVASLLLIVAAMKMLAKTETSVIVSGLTKMIAIMSVFALVMLATKMAGQHAMGAGVAIVAISVAMNLMTIAIKQMASIDDKMLFQATKAITAMLAMFALITAMTKFAGEHAIAAGTSIMIMAGAIVILAGAMILIAKIDDKDILKAVFVVDSILGMFALIVAALGKTKAAQKTLKQMTICLGMLVAAVAILALIDPVNLLSSSLAISMILATFALLAASTGKVTTKAMAAVWAMVAVVGVLAALIAAMSMLDTTNGLIAATAISELVVSIGSMVVLLSMFGAAVQALPYGAILKFAVGIDVIAIMVAALVALAGAVQQAFPQFSELLDSGIPILQKIGQAIGEFIGGVLGGIAAGASYGLVTLAENMSLFIEALKPFMDAVSNIDDSVVEGAAKLVGMMLMFAAADLLSALAFWTGGEAGILVMCETLPILGQAMTEFANSLDGINLEALAVGAEAAKAISEVGLVFSEGGFKSLLMGSGSVGLALLGETLPLLGDGLKKYGESVTGLAADAIMASVGPAKALVEISNSIAGEGFSLMTLFGGSHSEGLSKLSENLPNLGRALSAYGDSVANLNAGAINNSIGPLRSLVEISNMIETEGGDFLNWFMGSHSEGIQRLSENLPALGDAITAYGESVTDLKTGAVKESIDPLRSLVEISNMIETEGGDFLGWFMGSHSEGIQKLSENLPALGAALTGYSDSLDGFKSVRVSNSVEPLRNLVEISNMIDDEGGAQGWLFGSSSDGVNALAANLPTLGSALNDYSNNVANVKPDVVNTSVDCLRVIIDTLNSCQEGISAIFGGGTGGSITTLKEHLPSLGQAILDYNNNVADVSLETITNSTEALNKILEAIANGADYNESMRLLTSDLKTFSEGFKEAIDNLANVNYAGVDSAIDALNKIHDCLSNWSNNFPDITPALTKLVSGLRTAATTGVQVFVGSFQNAAPQAAAAALNMANQAINAIVNRLNKANSDFRNRGRVLIQNLANGMRNGLSYVMSAINTMHGQMLSSLSRIASSMISQGRLLMTNLALGIRSGANNVRNAVQAATNNLASQIRNQHGSMYSAGSYLMSGLTSGISGSSSGPINAAYNVGRKVVAALKRATDEHSPSKETQKIGRFFDEGLMIGIINYAAKAIGAAHDMGEDLVDEIRPIADELSFFDDLEPVITPTLDTSYVDKGIANLNSSFAGIGAVPLNMQGVRMASAFRNMTAKQLQDVEIQNGTPSQVINNYDLTQNNYSPKALSRLDIYRDTKNQFSRLKEVVNA